MANEQNLIPNSQRSPEELRENGRKGGIRSGQVRSARKTFKEELIKALSDEQKQKEIVDAIMKEAKKGNIKAFEVIRDTIGEKPKEQVENLNIETTYEDYINKVADEDEY